MRSTSLPPRALHSAKNRLRHAVALTPVRWRRVAGRVCSDRERCAMMRKDLPGKWRVGLAAVALCLLSAGAPGRESLRASFDHSEWHPHSMLVLDVATGGFQAEFRDGTRAVGRFSTDEMREIRARLAAARAVGFAPREGVEPVLVVSNG